MLEFIFGLGAFFSGATILIIICVLSAIIVPVTAVILYKTFWKRRIVLKDASGRILNDNAPAIHVAYLQGYPYGRYYFEQYNGNRLSETIPYDYNEEMQQTYVKTYKQAN